MKGFFAIPAVSLFFVSVAALAAGGAGRGVLTVTTTPVPGTTLIDGKALGETPLTVSLEGEHTVSFAEYSPQYTAPPARKVKVGLGDTLTIRGVYRNRLVPAKPPAGFPPADSVFVFGTKERNLRDGSIFDYIDGGAIMYLRHGLREATHTVYRDSLNSAITLDIYDMGAPEGAKAGFDDPEICPEGHGTGEIGVPCKTYHFEPDYFLFFHKSRFLVSVATNNDSLKTTVESFAARVGGNIP
ncbi:MAG: DUF6599 family protein [Candidatus Latescibacterota bacterium]